MTAKAKNERIVAVVLGVLVAYALLAILWFMVFSKSWSDAAKRFERSKSAYERERKTISERTMWDDRYEEEAAQIPVVGDGQGVDTKWMSEMDDLAKGNNVFVSERKPGPQEEMGDMMQITVDVKWTAALESLVKFMYALENADSGKFDVQAISFSQAKRQGYLSGTLTLTCIYKRE